MPARNPLCKIALSYFAGLISGYFLFNSLTPFLIFVAGSSTASLLLIRLGKLKFREMFLCMLPLLLGVSLINVHSYPLFPPQHIVNYAEGHPTTPPVDIEGTLTRPVEKRRDNSVLYISARALELKLRRVPAEGNISVTVNMPLPHLSYGDRVLIRNARLRLPGGYWNPGGFNYQAFMARRGIYVAATLWKDGKIEVIARGEGNGLLSLLYSFRERSAAAIDKNLLPLEAGILKAMILGETWDIGQSDRQSFARSGTAHLLSISGLHVGFVAFFSYYAVLALLKLTLWITITLRGTPFRARRWAALTSILPVVAYALMVGDKPPVTRAAVMVVTYMVARFLSRDKNLYNSLALAFLIIVIWKPLSVFEIGFQLSFLSVFFIIHYLQGVNRDPDITANPSTGGLQGLLNLSAWRDKILSYVLISLVATLATIPLIAHTFNQLSLNGPAANILAIPISFPLVPAGLLASLTDIIPAAGGAAAPLFAFSSLLTYMLRQTSSLFATASPLSFNVLTPWMPPAVPYYLLLVLSISRWRRPRFGLLLAGAAAAITLSFAAPYLRSHADDRLRVTFLDVGEGDAAVVRFPQGNTMVIDTGPAFRNGRDAGEIVLTPYLRSVGVRRIDYIVISHAQSDHAGGAPSLLRNFPVHAIWHNGGEMEKYLHPRTQDQDHAPPPSIRPLALKESPSPYFIGGVRIDVLNPPADPAARGMNSEKPLSENNRSLVVRLTYGDFSVLFTGDIERPTQEMLSTSGRDLRATVLKVPHHGSAGAVHDPFISAVSPEVAVISAGKYNRFRHPAQRALSAYARKKVIIYGTYKEGAVTIVSDGHNPYSVTTFLESLRPNDIRRLLSQ